MQVPLLDLRPQHEGLRDEIIAAVTDVIDSTRYIMGPELERFEEAVAEYSGC
jgi:dTDP-4-amino-4,6-dideoxygalactose transaminase